MAKSTATPRAGEQLLDCYRRPGAMTSAGRYASRLEGLPDDIAALVGIVQGLVIHEFAGADWYGVSVPEQRQGESHIRTVEQMLERLLGLDDRR